MAKPSMCCIGCGDFRLSVVGPEHVVIDSDGRRWLFEQHPYFGPIALRKDGDPKSRQPGSWSKFWPAWQAWNDARKSDT